MSITIVCNLFSKIIFQKSSSVSGNGPEFGEMIPQSNGNVSAFTLSSNVFGVSHIALQVLVYENEQQSMIKIDLRKRSWH